MSVPTPPTPHSLTDFRNSVSLSSSAPPTPSPVPAIPASPVTPLAPMTPAPVTPTTPTFSGKFSCGPSVAAPAPRVSVASVSDGGSDKGGRGRKAAGKATKTKEEKEREKELRKERLRVQQEKERQWKLLQQKRQLENQRQTQQHQQENILMRQELRRTQQTKAKPLAEEAKKKVTVKKAARRPSLPSVQSVSTLGEPSNASRENSAQEGTVLTVLQEGDTRMQVNATSHRTGGNVSFNEPVFEQQMGEQNLITSRDTGNQLLENNDKRSLSRPDLQMDQLTDLHPPPNPMSSGALGLSEDPSIQQQSQQLPQPQQQQQRASLSSWSEKGKDFSTDALWTQQQQQTSFALQPPNQSKEQVLPPQLGKDSQSELVHQRSWQQKPPEQNQPWVEPTQQHEESFHSNTSKPQQACNTQEHFQQPQQQSWPQNQFELGQQQQQPGSVPSITQVSQHDVFQHQNALKERQCNPEQSGTVDNRVSFQSSHHNVEIELPPNQRVEESNLPQGQPLSHWQHGPTSIPSQVRGQPLPQQQSQGQLQGFQHSDGHVPQTNSSSMSGMWPNATQQEALSKMQQPISGSQPNQPQSLQHLPQSEAQHPGISVPQQPMPQIPSRIMRPPSNPPHPALQGSAPIPPPPPPPPPVLSQSAQVPVQQPIISTLQNLPHDDPQQIELIQQQHREQLLRMQQQQQVYQLQMQQHQLLQQQQQQGGSASVQTTVLPASAPPAYTPSHQTAQFARPRAPQFVSPKDMPEIDSEEEHQERLRFLYKQRQAQKQQQLQSQLLQQQLAQGIMPGTIDPSNPQTGQQLSQIRPQFPELMQQQMMLEYQRRIAQRQGLGQQTLQYDKVLQEFQQRQGGHTGPQQGTVLDLPHQRFAIRPPSTGFPSGLQQGQVALYGLDPTKQQQLYQMQLQQQQQLLLQQQQQQQQQRKASSDQQSVPQTVTTSKATENESVKDIADITEMSTENSDKVPAANTKEVISSSTALPAEKEKMEKVAETLQKTEEGMVHLLRTKDDSRGDNFNVEAIKSEKTDLQAVTCKESDNCQDTKKVSEEDISNQSVDEHMSTAMKETPNAREDEKEKNEQCMEKEKTAAVLIDKPNESAGETNRCDNSTVEEKELTNISETKKQRHSGSGDDKPQHPEQERSPESNKKETENDTAEKELAVVLKEKREEEKIVNQPQQRSSQPQSGKSVSQVMLPNSQPQQQLAQQQLMGLGHQFSVMQQQQAIYMQQYQALHQQLQQSQGQNAVVGQSLITLQRQAQMLQQQMIQVSTVKTKGYSPATSAVCFFKKVCV